jgi:hypothetical protein
VQMRMRSLLFEDGADVVGPVAAAPQSPHAHAGIAGDSLRRSNKNRLYLLDFHTRF